MIKIAERLKPFSHQPGVCCLLPGTTLSFQIFPTKIEVFDLSTAEPVKKGEFALALKGPVKNFTVQLDLEKGCIRVWGHFYEGFVRYHLLPSTDENSWIMKVEKGSLKSLVSTKKQRALFTLSERLSFGSHKKQDFDNVTRRSDLKEIFPFWFRLGKMVPDTAFSNYSGTLVLLKKCQDLIASKEKEKIYQAFVNVFKAGFEGILCPRLQDIQFQGFDIPVVEKNFVGSPLALLKKGQELIEKLFLHVCQNKIDVLPLLLPQFHSGRLLGTHVPLVGHIDMEWSKKKIRQMIFRSETNQTLHFQFQKELKSYRLKHSPKEKGKRVSTQEPLELEAKRAYYFDNFQK